jgi:hypothetical protein
VESQSSAGIADHIDPVRIGGVVFISMTLDTLPPVIWPCLGRP